jgi:UPF0716 protein FxsA
MAKIKERSNGHDLTNAFQTSIETDMLVRLLLVFVTVPLIELYLLLQLSRITNPPTTIAVVVITGIFGAFLAKQQGWMAVWRFRQALAQGRLPTREIADTVMIVFAAGLLLTPGLITDVVGFALLIPTTRRFIRGWLLRRIAGRLRVTRLMGYGRGRATTQQTVDATFRPAQSNRQKIGNE